MTNFALIFPSIAKIYHIVKNAKNYLSEGIYYLRCQSISQTATKKFLVVK